MKKVLSLALLSILTIGMRAAEYDYLVFSLQDGTTEVVAAANLDITFSGDNIICSNDSETLKTLDMNKLVKMEFSADGTATGISTISATALTIDSATAIYDMNGRRMPNSSSLPKGMYIVKTPTKTFKVQMR